MKIAFDVDVLAKQMDINRMVHQVADWGYKYIEQSPHPRINPFYKHPLFRRNVKWNTGMRCVRPAWRFLPSSVSTAGPALQRRSVSLQLPIGKNDRDRSKHGSSCDQYRAFR